MSIQSADIHFYLLRLLSAVGYSSCANTLQNQFILCGSRQPVIRGRLYPVTIPLQNHLPDDEDLKQPNQECDYEYDEKYSQVAWAR